ncbi:hypothetical protein ACFXJ8_39145 [Nonomuraea sp. NPDC059194]
MTVVVVASLLLSGTAVMLARRAGKSMPAALLVGMSVFVGALGGLAALL